MATDFLKEYLVKLGFTTDTVSYAKFAGMLRAADALVDNTYTRLIKRTLEYQFAAVSAFASVGLGTLAFADKVAMADQEYRLLAMHMYTSLPVARELKVTLDALGQPLENIMWDAELGRRAHQLIEDQRTMTKELGPGFESQMLRIRDVRFEFTRLQVELQYLAMFVVDDLAKAFGTTIGGLLAKMREWNNWLISNMPAVSAWIVSKLKPALDDVRMVLADTWQLAKATGVAFTTLMGVLTGDKSLEATEFSFKNLATAIGDALKMLTGFIDTFTKSQETLVHLATGMADVAGGNGKAAGEEFGKAKALTTPTTAGLIVGGIAGGALAGPEGAVVGAAIGAYAGKSGLLGALAAGPTMAYIAAKALAAKVPPALALAVADIESGFRQFNQFGNPLASSASGSHATGIFQLQPGTARGLGVDPNTVEGNVAGGIAYLKQLLQRFKGNQGLALEHYYGSSNPAANEAYANKVLARAIQYGDTNITVHVSSDASPDEIAKAISKEQDKRRQRNIAQSENLGY